MLENTANEAAQMANEQFREYLQQYQSIEEDFREAVASYGLPFAQEAGDANDEDAYRQRVASLVAHGVQAGNDGKSLWLNWISPSCIACRLGSETETFLSSTQCPRKCYFCFNPNQADYDYYLTHVHDMAAELEQRHAAGAKYQHLAVTGGEPLLHKDATLAFFQRAGELYPHARTRLYTSGAGLDESGLRQLREAGLDEIRFSIKLDEGAQSVARTLETIERATRCIDSVMVEMPVMPDETEAMKDLLVRLDTIGIQGINLLELCFPFHNAEEFVRRGYRVKRRPYRVLYDYWYAGGLPIAGSEEACLDVLEFALEQHLQLGVHYCSLENKLTGQVFQQNAPFAQAFPFHTLSERDHFLKSAKAFGDDIPRAEAVLAQAGYASERNEDFGFVEFSLAALEALAAEAPDMPIGISTCIVELREGVPTLRELQIDPTTPATFQE